MSNPRNPVVNLISLGCSKNTVDSECILGNLLQNGITVAEDVSEADICLVNTCGFIDRAREESAQVLEELARLKTQGRLKAIVALGCLVERTAGSTEMTSFLHHADVRVGFAEYPRLAEICRRLADQRPTAADVSSHPDRKTASESFMRFLSSPRARIGRTHTAYLKISEGCSNLCRFCSIPGIRGMQVSRTMEDLLAEARSLIETGAREINLIAQDTTSYGKDLYVTPSLPKFLRRLKTVDSSAWFRMLYAHPRHLTAELLDVLATESHLCPYLDLPLQHIADSILKSMGRGMTKKETMDVLDRVAAALPRGALRTTFIVGYPGETAACFSELLALVQEGRFTHAGVFTYSSEPGTPAAKLEDDVPQREKEARRDALMQAQLGVCRKRLRNRVGQKTEIMVDGLCRLDEETMKDIRRFGRSRLEAPEVDGVVFLRGKATQNLAPGTRLQATIVDALDYDLVAEAAPG